MADRTPVNFDQLLADVLEVTRGPFASVQKLSMVCELLRTHVPHYDWVGFYVVAPENRRELVLGPFSGDATDHTRIPFGRGICGQAAEREETFVVQDVAQESNYLACSPFVKSEIVLPIHYDGRIVGELDIDSHVIAPFTDADSRFLESVCEEVAALIPA